MSATAAEVSTEAKKDLRLSKWLTAAGLAMTIINICGSLNFWYSLPEKQRQTKEQLVDHESRIRVLEADRGLLQTIDERTKNIQEDVRILHRDFSFRFNGNPKE